MRPSARLPPSPIPDIGRPASTRSHDRAPTPPEPEFLIIGLFALRLTQQLIQGLEYYADRDADFAWLASFLAPYPSEYALAKVSGRRKDDYIDTYQGIVSRMIRQPRYPVRFIQLNPDKSMQGGVRRGQGLENMTDTERLAIINFCDAASEWGSIVPIPEREAGRMVELADQRKIADLNLPRRGRSMEYMTKDEPSSRVRVRSSLHYDNRDFHEDDFLYAHQRLHM